MSGLTLKETAAASIPTPSANKLTLFADAADSLPKYRDDAGVLHTLTGPTGPAGPGLTVEEEGVEVATDVEILNFVGTPVSVVDSGGGRAAISITGHVAVQEDSTPVMNAATLNFIGATVTDGGGGVANVEVTAGDSSGSSGPSTGGGDPFADSLIGYWAYAQSAQNSPMNMVAPGGTLVAGVAGSTLLDLTGYMQTVTTANNLGTWNWCGASSTFTRGDAAGRGHWYTELQFGVVAAHSTMRFSHAFYWATSNDISAAEPSSRVYTVMFGCDSGDTNFQVMHNDATGTCTKIDTGFAKAAGAYLNVRLSCAGNGAGIAYLVTNLNTGATASGTITTNLPAANTEWKHYTNWFASGGGITLGAVKMYVRYYSPL